MADAALHSFIDEFILQFGLFKRTRSAELEARRKELNDTRVELAAIKTVHDVTKQEFTHTKTSLRETKYENNTMCLHVLRLSGTKPS
jgi:hypothetical protein